MKTITVDVTQDDIDNGKVQDCRKCAVALAFLRATGCESEQFTIGPLDLHLYLDGSVQEINLPECVEEFIDAFDEGDPVSPISFNIEVPDWIVS